MKSKQLQPQTQSQEYLPPVKILPTVAAKIVNLSVYTLKLKRSQGELIEGVHWYRCGKRIMFDEDMIRHWHEWRHQPEMHRRKVAERQQQVAEMLQSLNRP